MLKISYKRLISRFMEEKNKGTKNLVLFLLSRFLRYSRFCYFFTIEFAGCKMRFSPLAVPTSLFVNGDLEPGTTEFLQKNLKDGDVYIDIGANVGTTTLVAASVVGNSGIVLCFEPNKRTYKALTENIKINKFNNILSKQCALGDSNGVVYFSSGDNDDMNRITEDRIGNTVQLATLDSYTQHLNKIRLIKIDVEGYELRVLRGAILTLAKTDIVLFESIEKNAQNYGFRIRDILDFFQSHNFRIMDMSLGSEYHDDENFFLYPANLVAVRATRR